MNASSAERSTWAPSRKPSNTSATTPSTVSCLLAGLRSCRGPRGPTAATSMAALTPFSEHGGRPRERDEHATWRAAHSAAQLCLQHRAGRVAESAVSETGNNRRPPPPKVRRQSGYNSAPRAPRQGFFTARERTGSCAALASCVRERTGRAAQRVVQGVTKIAETLAGDSYAWPEAVVAALK